MSTSGVNLNSLGLNSGTATTGSGIDVTSVVAQILDAERAPERLLQQQQATLATQANTLTSINTSLNALRDSVNALKDLAGALDGMVAISSNTSILTASAQSSAASGSHIIEVQNLATTSSYYTDPVATSTAPSDGHHQPANRIRLEQFDGRYSRRQQQQYSGWPGQLYQQQQPGDQRQCYSGRQRRTVGVSEQVHRSGWRFDSHGQHHRSCLQQVEHREECLADDRWGTRQQRQ